jgi:hypothetical protein
MKTAVAAISTILALLLVGAAQAQPQSQSQSPQRPPDPRGGMSSSGFTRPPLPTRPPSHVQPPFFGRPPFFGQHPFFFGPGLVVASPVATAPSTYVYSYPTPVYVPYAVDSQPQPQYWAYCRSAQGYYPYVPDCPGGWLPVLPTSTPPPAPSRVSGDTGREMKQAPVGGMPIEELRERIARSRAD